MSKRQTPYGEWPSPITSERITAQAIGLEGGQWLDETLNNEPRALNSEPRAFHSEPRAFHSEPRALVWLETRPQEAGRSLLVKRTPDGKETELTPAPYSVRSRVHEYGGGAWTLHGKSLYFTNFADQQVYAAGLQGDEPRQLTHAPGLRFADGCMDAGRGRLLYVIEDHNQEGEPKNSLGAVDLRTGAVRLLAEGHDFYAAPRLSPDGRALAWLAWDHPNMPWDETLLCTADIQADGSLGKARALAGGKGVSVQQPRYSPDGALHYVSDESGWWNLYAHDGRAGRNLCPREAEFGMPPWGLGLATYGFLPDASLVCIYSEGNQSRLARLQGGALQEIPLPLCDLGSLSIAGSRLLLQGASPTSLPALYTYDLNGASAGSGDGGKAKSANSGAAGGGEAARLQRVKASAKLDLDPGYISVAEAIAFKTAGGETAHAFHYPPTNKDCEGPKGKAPPLLVILHGGPTGASQASLSLRTQYWTSRGFALLDINYRGSTGYGRAYRDRLKGAWGLVDVEDCVAGAERLVADGKADPARLAIRGGSAGGYTTLAALAFTDTFKAGASHYGVADLEALAKDTHKFESRYLDSLVGPYPQDKATYQARSPIHHAGRLSSPVIFFQGLEDKIVPPNQAEMMVKALAAKGIPVAYVPFPGEHHGFRQAKNIKRALDLELRFYSRIFNFPPADKLPPLKIPNL